MFEGQAPAFRHEVAYARMNRFFNMKGPGAENVVSLDDIAEDGAGRVREHASFE